jgi:phosphorylcholine metabolism protein LicD
MSIDNDTKRKKYKNNSIKDLKCVKKILEKENVFFWLMSGSLLGCFVREKILPGDDDIDLGFYLKERRKVEKVIPKLEGKGFSVKKRYDVLEDKERKMINIKRKGMRIDLKFYEDVGHNLSRNILMCRSKTSAILWNIIDIIYYGYERPFSVLSEKRIRSYMKENIKNYPKISEELFLTISRVIQKYAKSISVNISYNKKMKILKRMSFVWRKMNTVYGVVMIPKSIFSEFTKKNFHGMEFNIPKESEKFLRVEYGKRWNEGNSGRGGIEKPSHFIFKQI